MRNLIQTERLSEDSVAIRTRQIYDAILGNSANVTMIDERVLERLFDLYDRLFFGGRCRRQLGDRSLVFRVSQRMTRVGAQTRRFGVPAPGGGRWGDRFEIAVSAPLVLESFSREKSQPVTVCGIACRDRLEVLQRLLEHEIVHLVELVVWDQSKCGARRFGSIAERFFAHRDHRHHLATRAEQLLQQYDIQPGDLVAFRHRGRERVGRMNGVRKRVTVLVEDPAGRRYSDGRRYTKFYVPVERLRPAAH